MTRVLLSWSSGKDSAWSLEVLRQTPDIEVVGLVTTINEAADRVAMHAVRRTLLARQADCAGLPLHVVPLPYPCSNADYEAAMHRFLATAADSGVDAVAFGDLFLGDVRQYRVDLLRDTRIEPLFPLWGEDTHALAATMMEAGLRARVTCIDPRRLPRELAGCDWDRAFLDALPEGADPCGENGEFHTFTWAGPMFSAAIAVDTGKTIERDGFVFTDLTAAECPAGD